MEQVSTPPIQGRRLADAITYFLQRKEGYGGHLISDGRRLYSYLTIIAQWEGEAVRLPNPYKMYSRTTSRHRNMLRVMATAQDIVLKEV